jgi:hypothetical protein
MTRLPAFLLALALVGCTTGPAPETAERWTVAQATEWYAAQPWMVGANFNPSTAINQIEMWQEGDFDPETIDRELGWAADIGMNTMRVYLHYMVWAQHPEGLKERMETYLSIADRHGIKTIFVPFDDVWGDNPTLGPQPAPRPGVHNSGWVESPGLRQRLDPALRPALEAYITGLLTHFSGDERVLMWDLYNEPGNGKNPPSESLDLLQETVRWARAANPSQPISIGVWTRHPDFDELNAYQLAVSDVITFHSYMKPEDTRPYVEWLREQAGGRPLIVTEYMARSAGNTFENHLPYWKEEGIGAINWGLVSGKSNTIFPWGHPETPAGEVTVEPDPWFHDVFRADGTPYSEDEVDLIRSLTGRGQ